MVPHNYIQVAVFENEVCLGISGCWSATKLWTGKYLEIDNFIVNPEHRSKGIEKLLTDYIEQKALALDCCTISFGMLSREILLHTVFIIIRGMVQWDFILLKY